MGTKKKILFVGWGKPEQETMRASSLRLLPPNYDLLFVSSIVEALNAIAYAALQTDTPIDVIVFQRQTLVKETREVNILKAFAADYNHKLVIIKVVWHDEDEEAKNSIKGFNMCKEGAWISLRNMIEEQCKG